MEFCKAFNEKTKNFMGKPVPVVITVYKDKKFDFIIKSPPASHFIKEAAKLKSGSTEPGRQIVASITKKQAEEISAERRPQVGSGDRSEKIRTYNFPQNRVTDHRIGVTLHNLPQMLNGQLDGLLDQLSAAANEN